ncbi:hypothetical protein LSUE1_G005540 [Lachnellula suecica]|uniref:Uncharacterized protein n=1 Tax=Lachnellula suecica TaxID=602035 RepID=A0A8T9C509_9HELO|nr:hypothetical protein LSUE1_G005540 [Lachnellula suecica]
MAMAMRQVINGNFRIGFRVNVKQNPLPAPNSLTAPNTFNTLIIDAAGDLVIRLYTTKNTIGKSFKSADDGRLKGGRIIVAMQVSRDVIIANSTTFAIRFKNALVAASAASDSRLTIDIPEGNEVAFEVWVRAIHEGAMNSQMYSISIEDVWNVLQAHKVYQFELQKLNSWFEEWVKNMGGDRCVGFTLKELPQLMLPCQKFENDLAFARITRRYAYEGVQHLPEKNPTSYYNLRSAPRVIGGLNTARGNLKTEIHKALYLNRQFLTSECSCRKDGLFAFELAMDKTGAWPLEEKLHGKEAKSIQAVLQLLETFTYEPPNKDCKLCSTDFATVKILPGVQKVRQNFGGLCLNCMANPKDKNQYRDRVCGQVTWDKGCKFRHDQLTWYFSWLASKDKSEQEREEQRRKDQEESN